MAVNTSAGYHIAICAASGVGTGAAVFAAPPSVDTLNGDLTTSWVDAIAANTLAAAASALVAVVCNHDSSPMYVAPSGDEDKYHVIAAGQAREFEYNPDQAFKVRK